MASLAMRSVRTLFLLTLTGCFQSGPINCAPVTTPTSGELGNGNFDYMCEVDGDSTCDDGLQVNPMPRDIVLNGTFRAQFLSLAGGTLPVNTTSSEFIERTSAGVDGARFKAVKAGTAALIAEQSGRFIDFVHVRIAEPDHLQIDSVPDVTEPLRQDISTLEVVEGESREMRALLVDSSDNLLAGGLPCQWTSSDDTVASVDGAGSDNQVRVNGMKPGTAILHVDIGGLSSDVAVTITINPGDTVGSVGSGGSGSGGASGTGGAGGTGGGAGGAGGGP